MASPAAASARTIAVVGGGWAGLAAAVEATRRGHAVTLFEMAPQLGGRARSVAVDGHVLDNGQHLLIGAYAATLGLMREVGVDTEAALWRTPLRLTRPDGSGLHLPRGAPVIAFARAVLAQHRWPVGDRWHLLTAAAGWAAQGFRCDASLTVAALTARLPMRVRAELIDPLCVAALNTPAATASAVVFLRVLKDALFSGPGSADLLIPRVGLSELLPDAAQRWLIARGATVRLQRRARSLQAEGDAWWIDGECFDAVVLAATPAESARLAGHANAGWAATAAALAFEPIVTVYASSPGTRLDTPMLALQDDDAAPAQFVFDRGQLGGPAGLLAFVVSGARRWTALGLDATAQATRDQARRQLGVQLSGPLRVVHTIAEKRATFSCTPGLARPAARIAPGLVAAGDCIEGPYPATLEGAVLSGTRAVDLLG